MSGELHQRRQQDHQSLQSLPARTRHRLGCSARRAARPRQFLHLRAAGRQRRVRDVPEPRGRPDRARIAAVEGLPRRPGRRFRLPRRSDRLGTERRSRLRQTPLHASGRRPPRSRNARRRLSRPLDLLQIPGGFGQGADRAARPYRRNPRQSRLRADRDAGTRFDERPCAGNSGPDPLRAVDQRRILRLRIRREAGRHNRERFRNRSPGDAEALRPRQPRVERPFSAMPPVSGNCGAAAGLRRGIRTLCG